MQFAAYVALGSYLMEHAEQLSVGALLLGWGLMAFGLFVLGTALENRPWALRLELLRLGLNAPAMLLAGTTGLWPVTALAWVLLLGYSLLSLFGLYGSRFLARNAGSLESPAQPQAAAEHQQAAEHP
ncbi:hypothetical protein D9M73_266910 [compost metagenome]